MKPLDETVASKEDQQALKDKVAEILKAMDEEEPKQGPGLRCPKCGGRMAHSRLYGYQCIRGCQ